MTPFLNHYTLKYTPLSPLHIGTGESYEPGNYVIDDEAGALYSFDSRAALAGLTDSDRQQLLAIVNGKPDDNMLTKVQAFFHTHREKLLAFANLPIPTSTGILRHYLNRIGKTANKERNGRVINKLEIERTFYNPVDCNPVLPGTSIKGAIRTALLDAINNGRSTKHRKHRDLQEELFQGSFQTDPMRLISIGDAVWQGNIDKPLCQVKFAINCKRKPVEKGGELLDSQADKKGLYQLLECISPEHYQGFSGSLTLQNTRPINQDDRKMPKQNLQWSIKDIAKACNDFYYEGLFWQEINAMKDRHYLKADWVSQIEQLLDNGLSKRLHDGDAYLLRIGRHSGAEALTLNGVRNIMIKGEGKEKTWEKQPKTWWLASDDVGNKQGLLPFGWLLVEIDPKEPDSPLQQWLENGNSDLTAWMQQQLTKQNALKQKAEFRQCQEQEKRQAEQQIAEQMRLQQEADQQRRASMTEQQLLIEALKQQLQQKQAANVREQIGGPLYGAMRELINQATAWLAEDKAELLEVAKNILELINASGNKTAKELLKKLQ